MNRDDRIKLEDCQNRKLYRVWARNIRIAVYDADRKEFLGIRTKFGQRFVDSENHWDAPAYATCCPMEVLGELPSEINLPSDFFADNFYETRQALFNWLEEQEKLHPYDIVCPS